MGLEKNILKKAGRAIGDYRMIEAGDRVMVALSGGKDSWTLLHALECLRKKAPIDFSVVAVTVDPGTKNFDSGPVTERLEELGIERHVERSDIYETITASPDEDPKGYCAFCARLRRGILYRLAGELGCTKVALGHHADDLIETLLMSAFFNGELRTMPPRLVAEDGKNVVIRPLCYVFERETAAFAEEMGFPVIGCGCPVCGGSAMKRRMVKEMLAGLEKTEPEIKMSLLASLGNVKPKYLLDRRHY